MQPILKIDLSTKTSVPFHIPQDWVADFLGGASLAARILYNDLLPELDPLSPEAPLLILNGPLSGTSGPAVGRFVICGKSPATQLWAESNCGGFWGPELRRTGYDGLWITGRAALPTYMSLINGKLEFHRAQDIWGQDTYELQEQVRNDLSEPGARVLGIGIAGENQVPYALILTDHGRVAGRTGMGAVMGAKNLKAIAVRGTGDIPVARPEEYKSLRSTTNRELRNDNLTTSLRELGTAAASDYFDYLGEMPKKGYTRGLMEGVDRITGTTIAETILVGISACHACVIACGRVVVLPGEKEKRKGPEYETIAGFGPNLWINDPAIVTELGELCDRYGLDSISTSNTLSFAITLFELGILTREDTGGLDLKWGDGVTAGQLVAMIAKREGFGAQLAEGARALGRRYGKEERAVQVNGLEVAYHDPRGASGMALVYATSPRGACHNQSDYFIVDIGQAEEDLGMRYFHHQAGAEKAANVAVHQDLRTNFNALVLCLFSNVSPHRIIELINLATGLDWELVDFLKAGERAWNLKRAINIRLGLTRANDRLPAPLLEPLPDGGAQGYVVPFDEMLSAYYEARGWDWETGKPVVALLKDLALDFVIPDLWPEA